MRPCPHPSPQQLVGGGWKPGPKSPVESYTDKKTADSLFAKIWAAHASNLILTVKVAILALFTGTVGWVVVQTVKNVAGFAATAVTGASYLGAWALAMQGYRTVHMLMAYIPAGTPLAAIQRYVMDAVTGSSPIPPPAAITFFPEFDPRLCSALIGSILTLLGCVKGG